MKRQYIFLVLIFITLYIIYLILNYKFREYAVSVHIESLERLKGQIEAGITEAEGIIEYKTTAAYKNKILKEQQGLKNKAEQVVYLTTEEKFNKFTQKTPQSTAGSKTYEDELTKEQKVIKNMTNYEKWMYYLFNLSN